MIPFLIILREDIESLNFAHQLGIYLHTHCYCIGNLTCSYDFYVIY